MPAPIADGQYIAKIAIITNEELQGEDGRILTFTLDIMNGPQPGLQIKKVYRVKSDGAAAALKNELSKLGVTVNDGNDFKNQQGSLTGLVVELSAKTNENGYQCYRFTGLATMSPRSNGITNKRPIGW